MKIQENIPVSQPHPLKYFDLIEQVGSQHKFQYLAFIAGLLLFFFNGITTFNSSYIFKNPQFNCSQQNLEGSDCQQYVCNSVNKDLIPQFPRYKTFETLATQFGPYYCQSNQDLGFYRGIQSIGSLFGIPFLISFSDNESRKKALLLCLFFMFTGFAIMCLSANMLMACIGLFIVGLGNNISLKIIQVLISEVTHKRLVGKFFSSLLFPFSVSFFLVGPLFSIFSHWRLFTLFFCLIPSGLLLLYIYYFCEDPPRYLLRTDSVDHAYQALKRISNLNDHPFTLTKRELEAYFEEQKKFKEVKDKSDIWDMFRYKSLRIGSICFCVISCVNDFFYYCFSAMIDKIGFNQIVNGYVIGIGSIMIIPLGIIFSPKLPRQKSGIATFSTIFMLGIALQFMPVDVGCFSCPTVYVQIGLVIVVQSLINFQGIIIYQHYVEFFPVSIRNIGYGFPIFCGSLGIFISQFAIVSLFQKFERVFFVVSSAALIGVCAYINIPQTLNKPLKDHIEQVSEQAYEENQLIEYQKQ